MFAQFNDAARLVLRLADEEARRARRGSIDTEHLVLALIQLHNCVATRLLRKGGIDLATVRREVAKLAPPGDEDTTAGRRPITPAGRKAIDLATAAAERLGHGRVGTGHLLLGLLEEAEGVAFRVLCKVGIGRLGANLSRLAERLDAERESGPPW